MTSVLEQTRAAQEACEIIEKTLSKVLQERAAYPDSARVQVACEGYMRLLIDETSKNAKDALELYEDKDNLRAEECDFLAGIDPKKPENTIWNSFYEKIKEVKTYHRKNPIAGGIPERRDPIWYYNRAKEQDQTDASFSAEEAFGKRVDLHVLYNQFINWKKYRDVREKKYRDEVKTRLLRNNKELDLSDPEIQKKLAFVELDYVKWLQTFHEFWDIPRHCKYRDNQYRAYLQQVNAYLESFVQRAQPLLDLPEIIKKSESDFSFEWEKGQKRGWEEPTCKMPLYARATDRLCANEATKASHEKSKAYMKKLSQMTSLGPEDIEQFEFDSRNEDRVIAAMEHKCHKLLDLVQDQVREAVNICQLKQSMTEDEYAEHMENEQAMFEKQAQDLAAEDGTGTRKKDDEKPEDEDNSDNESVQSEDRAIYNPLKLPIGWDGKPIPFWLYKLHDMGREYKCEICGNHSYWGPRAFHQHFSEWRHANGLRALKIPNTKHFAEITKIVDAVALWEKLRKEAGATQFEQDGQECEDASGNVMTKRAYDDLRRQGLV
ncbi:unnamed protein product [Amoebophrya sp. A120]|nr:unnamed protein product [Amoebophrya sp. A120]|eukprot:GSA120T00002021001.1